MLYAGLIIIDEYRLHSRLLKGFSILPQSTPGMKNYSQLFFNNSSASFEI